MLPSDVYELRLKKPLDFSLMRGYIRAKFELENENYEIKPPSKSKVLNQKLQINGLASISDPLF